MIYNKISLVATAPGAMPLTTSAGINIAASRDGGLSADVAIIAVAIGTLIAVPAAMFAWRDRRWKVAAATMVLILAAEARNGWHSFERVLAVRAGNCCSVGQSALDQRQHHFPPASSGLLCARSGSPFLLSEQ